MSSDKFCLKWNDFQTNIISSYKDLRQGQDFTDVTLVCEDNQRIEAHMVILSSASNFFKSVLVGNKHSHPLIYMRNIKTRYMTAIIDFIYHGEILIYQEDLNDFLGIAEELGIKGLAENSRVTEDINPQENLSLKTKLKHIDEYITKNTVLKLDRLVDKDKLTQSEPRTISLFNGSYVSEAMVSPSFREENTELDETINSMLAKVDGLWTCTKCGRTNNHKTKIRMHIETHIEGISFPCGHCGKTFRSRNVLQSHSSRAHTTN